MADFCAHRHTGLAAFQEKSHVLNSCCFLKLLPTNPERPASIASLSLPSEHKGQFQIIPGELCEGYEPTNSQYIKRFKYHTIKYHLAIKGNKVLIDAIIWMNRENIK